jgi:hypothetical protein
MEGGEIETVESSAAPGLVRRHAREISGGFYLCLRLSLLSYRFVSVACDSIRFATLTIFIYKWEESIVYTVLNNATQRN